MQRADVMTDFFFFLQLCLLKKFRICQFYCGLAVDVSSGQPFLCWVQMRRKSHATKTKHTKQNYRVISNLLFKVSVFLNFAHKFQCWVELCLLFIFGESVTIEIENLKKKNHLSPLSLDFLSSAPLALYPPPLFSHVPPSPASSIVFFFSYSTNRLIFSHLHPNMMGIFLYESEQNTEWMWGWD